MTSSTTTGYTIVQYSFFFIIAVSIGYFVNKYHEREENDEQEKELNLIKRFLLNESPLYEMNKPILWVHTKYEVNSRKWKSFYSRNSMDLNMPYVHLTIRTIIGHCGKDFNVCLIDDETFRKLLPSWEIEDMSSLPEPMKSRARTLGLLELLYHYGGMVVPNSFVCQKSLIDLYQTYAVGNSGGGGGGGGGSSSSTKQHIPFVVECPNHTTFSMENQSLKFIPNLAFMGVKDKYHETLQQMIDALKTKHMEKQHFHMETEFTGDIPKLCYELISNNRLSLVNGKYIGTKRMDDQPLLIEDLLSEQPFKDVLYPDALGVWIPTDEILSRTKYQWFAYLNGYEILSPNTNLLIAKYLAKALTDISSQSLTPKKSSLVIAKH